MKKVTKIKACFLLLYLLIVAGCAPSYSARPLSAVKLFKQRQENALNSNKPSMGTQQYLRLQFLDKKYQKDSEGVITQLQEQLSQTSGHELKIAVAELSLLEARKNYNKNREDSTAMFLNSAAVAFDYLLTSESMDSYNTLKPSYRFIADIYNRAVSSLVEIKEKKGDGWKETRTLKVLNTTYEFSIKTDGPELWDPRSFDSFRPANQIRIEGVNNQYFLKGLGAPLVGYVENPQTNPVFGKFSSDKGLAYPITALVTFEPQIKDVDGYKRKASVNFYDPLFADFVIINDRQIPLEADLSTPLGVLLSKLQPQKAGLDAMLKSDKYIEQAGLFMLEPFRQNKVPLVMVHGLMSTPETWVPMFNDIRGDPELREKYQIWFFRYPTGLPIAYSSSLLRKELLEVQSEYDPDHNNPYFNNMIIIGHSMGGLLTRLMIQDSQDIYWNSLFAEPIESIDLSGKDKQFLKDIFYFKTLPFIKRVVFISTPHRGSNIADEWFAKLGSGLLTLPGLVEDVGGDVFKLHRSELTADSAQFSKRVPNSLDLLSPTSIFTIATNKVPLNPDIPHHSLIGVRNSKTGPGSSDGIVPYESSHLDTAVSEKLIPSTHGSHKHPLAIAEVKRILKLHLRQL